MPFKTCDSFGIHWAAPRLDDRARSSGANALWPALPTKHHPLPQLKGTTVTDAEIASLYTLALVAIIALACWLTGSYGPL